MQSDTENSDASAKRGLLRSRKLWLSILGVLAVLVIFLPNIVLAMMGGKIQRQLSHETGLHIQCDSLSAGWFSPVTVNNLSASTVSGQPVVTLQRLRTQKSLWGLIAKDIDVGGIEVESLVAYVSGNPATREELKAAIAQMDPRSGLLKHIADPDKDVDVRFLFDAVEVQLQTKDSTQWKSVASTDSFKFRLQRGGEITQVSLHDGQKTTWQVKLLPEVCDHGLKFVAPVLSGALDVDGDCSLAINTFQMSPDHPKDLLISGTLSLHAVNAEIETPLIQNLTKAIGHVTENGVPLNLQIADESVVSFAVKDRVVTHSGLSFGLPKVLPSLVLTSGGDVGLDGTLDFQIAAAIPFENMGEAALLQKLGAPELAVPVRGTFAEPKIEIGKGKAIAGLAQEVVESATNGNVDIGPLLEKVGELELLEKLKQRRTQKNEEEEEFEISIPPLVAEDEPMVNEEAEEQKREGILSRIRKRREQRAQEKEND